MEILLLPPDVWVFVIFTIAAVGCIAALHAWKRVSEESKGIRRAEIALTADASWNDAYPHHKLELATWLRATGVKPDSHLGDFIRTCWSAWLGGRPASLTELHVLVARRERTHSATRFSAGVAALLLVFGIVGTLSAIKPVLRDFQFNVATLTANPDGDSVTGTETEEVSKTDASVSANTILVNSLIHNLGNAFWPSLLALAGTIAVVTCRGFYSHALHKFTLDLDRFAVDTLIPRYRVPSLSEQYQDVKATLTNVAESLLHRETKFHQAVEMLENLVGGIGPALQGLDVAATASKDAADVLSSRSQSITDGLSRHLGAKSPIHCAISNFGKIFEKVDKSLTGVSASVEKIDQSYISTQKSLESAIQQMSEAVGRVAEDHRSHQVETDAALKDFKEGMAGIPNIVVTTTKESVAAGIEVVKSSIDGLNLEQKEWHAASADEFKTVTAEGLADVAKASKELVSQAENVATAANGIKGIGIDIRADVNEVTKAGVNQLAHIGETSKSGIETAIKILTDAGIKQIGQTGAASQAMVRTAAERLAKESGEIRNTTQRLSKLGFDAASTKGDQDENYSSTEKWGSTDRVGKKQPQKPGYSVVRPVVPIPSNHSTKDVRPQVVIEENESEEQPADATSIPVYTISSGTDAVDRPAPISLPGPVSETLPEEATDHGEENAPKLGGKKSWWPPFSRKRR